MIKITFANPYIELEKRQQKCTFENYKSYNAEQKKEINEIKDNMDKWFLFYGKPGTGKGHIAISIYKIKKEQGKSCKYIQAFELLEEIKTNYDTSLYLMQEYANYDFLIIDEFEKILSADNEKDKNRLFYMMNKRYDKFNQTILITNLEDPDDIYEYMGKYLYDRFFEVGKSIYFNWESYRKIKKGVKA